jgi:hypothetical protein
MGTRHAAAALLTAGLAASVLAAGCGSSPPGNTGYVGPSDAPAPRHGSPLGAQVTVDGFPGAVGSVTVSRADSWTRSARPLSDPPREGAYVEVRVSARSVGTEPFDFYPFDFYLVDAAGHRYEYGAGNGWAEYSPDEVEGGRIRPGEEVSGALLFDASPRVDRLVYAPLGTPLKTWQLAG